MKIICTNCRYFKNDNKGNAVGECYRHPPTMSIIADKEQLLGFSRISGMPEVGANDFCGEFDIDPPPPVHSPSKKTQGS